ncbi:MAG TPA: HAMP domain-containing sensor histidine kinase [Rhizomicrobium sp.]|nr:HAMP domain-containing sensor histidine kinase [Rhizomicrobium sp.]
MAESRAAVGTAWSLPGVLSWPIRRVAGNIRLTVALSVVLICGSFAAAAFIQMRNDRAHALSEAASFDDERAQELALDLGGELNRYAAIGAAFTNAASSAETSAALSEAGGTALRNIAVLDLRGELQSELTSAPKGFLPLPPDTLDQALTGHAIAASRDGKSFAILFNEGNHIVAVELDAKALMPSAGEREALLATLTGEVVALGSEWRALPSVEALSLDNQPQASREIDVADGRRIVALRRVEGWPLAVAASSRVGEALGAWYGSLPLYFFVIFGPALAGGGLAVIFVREFERRARTTEAVKNLRATKPEQARLLVRLADAERRAVEAERARREFVGHMSHELRTPLNAIIGFSEVIERGVFGQHRKYSEYARDIGLAGRELHGKIGDILDFANLEGRKSAPVSAPIDIVPIVRQVVDEAIPTARAKGVRLAVSLPMVAEAAADPTGVHRILSNILRNAMQYSPSGGTIRLQVKNIADAVMINVRDPGLGFSTTELARAGEAFCRFDRPGCTTGVGMGLAVAMRLARGMGGNLRLASVQGESTTAELRLAKK